MPDDWPAADFGGPGQPVNLIESIAEFAQKFPAWTGADGYPMTWAHFQHGMRHLARAAAQEKIRFAEAVNVGQAGGDHLDNWRKQQRAAAGYLH